MRYPGAPHPRWWQIENHRVDIGAYGPDRGHFATMLLVDLISGHGDDWFTFPLVAEAGTVLKVHSVRIKDAFDEEWEVRVPPEMDPPEDWTLFRVSGLDASAQLVWPIAVAPLSGSELEVVVVGIDEDANLLWAVEQRLAGRDVPTTLLDPAPPATPGGAPSSTGTRTAYRYRPTEGARAHWHPYPLDVVDDRRRFVQGRLRSRPDPARRPDARTRGAPARPARHGPPDRAGHDPEPGAAPEAALDDDPPDRCQAEALRPASAPALTRAADLGAALRRVRRGRRRRSGMTLGKWPASFTSVGGRRSSRASRRQRRRR